LKGSKNIKLLLLVLVLSRWRAVLGFGLVG